MATWVRAWTTDRTSPNDTNFQQTENALTNGTAPADFDPAAVNSVRIQLSYNVRDAGGDDYWATSTSHVIELEDTAENTLATITASGLADTGNASPATSPTAVDVTDNSPNNARSTTDWEGAIIQFNSQIVWNKVKGSDANALQVLASSTTITIDYTPAVAAKYITPGLAQQLTTTFAPTVTQTVPLQPGLAEQLVTTFTPQVWSYLTDVIHYRWAEDSVITSPTWAAAEDAPLQLPTGTLNDKILYWRWGADGNPPPQLHHAEYRLNGGAWANVLTGSTGAMHSWDSANVSAGSWAVANFKTTPGTRTEYNGRTADAFTGATIDLLGLEADTGETEWIFVPGFYLASAGDVFELRIVVSPAGTPATETFLVNFGVVASVPQEITPGLAQSLVTAFDPWVSNFDTLHARWSTDTTLTAPSWQSTEDGPLSVPVGGSTFILYMLGAMYGRGVTRSNGLSYRKNGGAWAIIPTTNAAGPHVFNSTNVSNGLGWSTANFQLTAGGVLTPLNGVQFDTQGGLSWQPAEDREFEWVWAVEFEGVAEGDVFDFAFNLAGNYADPEVHSLFVTAYAPQGITPGLATQLTTTFDPTVAGQGDFMFPDLAQSLATAFDPTLVAEEFITPPLAQQLVTTSAPTLTREALLKLVAFELSGTYVESAGVYITPGLHTQLVTTFAPTLVWEEFITPGLASSITQAFNPTLVADQAITPALASSIAVAFDPTLVWELFVTPDLASSIVVAFDPTLLQAQAITPGLAQSLVVAFDPTLVADQAITPALAQSLVVAFDPTLTYTYGVAPGLATSLVAAFDPTVVAGPVTLTPDLASSLAVGFDPSIVLGTQYIEPGLVQQLVTPQAPLVSIFGGDQFVAPALTDQLVTPFDPTLAAGSVSMTPGLASSLAQAFDPTLTTGATTITPGLAQTLATAFDPNLTTTYGLTPGLASNVAVAFDPSIVTGSVSITPGLATSLAQAFDPTVALGADYLFPDLAQQLVVTFDPSGIAQTQNIAPLLTSSLVVAFDPFVDLGTKYAEPELALSLFVAFDPFVMYWMPTLPGSTSPTGQLGGTTSRPSRVGVTAGSDEYAVTSSGSGLAYTDPET